MFEGVFPPASSPFEPSNPNYVDLNDARPFDPERARELASRYEEEHGEPLAFEMMVAPSPERASLAQYLQQVLGESGIEMTVRTVDVAGAAVNLTQGNFEVFIYEVAGNPTLNTEFANIEGEPAPIGEFTLNFTRLDDQQLLDAIAESRASPTDEGRVRATRQAQQQLAELRAFLFLVHKQTAIVFSNDVHGVDRYPFPDDHAGRVRLWQCLVLRPLPQGQGSFRSARSSTCITSSAYRPRRTRSAMTRMSPSIWVKKAL
jgi:ABC-type transport system substrate-binding protein